MAGYFTNRLKLSLSTKFADGLGGHVTGNALWCIRNVIPLCGHNKFHRAIGMFKDRGLSRDFEIMIDNRAKAKRGWRDDLLRLSKGTA